MRFDTRFLNDGGCLPLSLVFALALPGCGDNDPADNMSPVHPGGGISSSASNSHAQSGGKTNWGDTASTVNATVGGANHSVNSTVGGPQGGMNALGLGGSAAFGSGSQHRVDGGSSTKGGTTSKTYAIGGTGLASLGGSMSGTGGSPNASGTAATIKGDPDVLRPLAKEFCAAAAACCKKDGLSTQLGDCESAYLTRQPATESIERGTVTLNSAALSSCVSAYQTASTQCTAQAVIDACQNVFRGIQAEGQSCANVYECSDLKGPSVCLFVGSNSEPGVCKITPHGQEGDPCASTCALGQDCSYEVYGAADTVLTQCFEADGVYCDYMAESPVCVPTLALGSDCILNDECGSENVCEVTCKKRSTLGQSCGVACMSQLMCVAGTCQATSFATESVCDGAPPAP